MLHNKLKLLKLLYHLFVNLEKSSSSPLTMANRGILLWAVCLCVLWNLPSLRAASDRPNIVMIVADDLGWNDVGYNNPGMITPSIDALARNGLILDQTYVQPLCSPSRTAWMTGVYPFKLGMQHLVIKDDQDVCVPLDQKFFPQILQENGYKTHMVGKWHLGFCNWKCTPTYRGFDSFYGFYNYGEDYYNRTMHTYFDFRHNREVDRSSVGEYSTYSYVKRSEEIIKSHDKNKPLFLYLPFQSVHEPLQVPEKFSDLYSNVKLEKRKIFAGMVTAMDEAIDGVVESLKENGLYDNTLIIFTADNGGWTPYGGNNYPLRGGKVSVFEGGTRVAAFVHGPMLKKTGVRHSGMMHAVDWFPTILEAAGIEHTGKSVFQRKKDGSSCSKDEKECSGVDIDGLSQWTALTSGGTSPRSEFIYNLDLHPVPVQGRAAIRVGDYKLIDGYPGVYQGWYQEEDENQGLDAHLDSVGPKLMKALQQGKNPDVFDPKKAYVYLFNVKEDPEERNNLFNDMPEKVRELRDKLDEYGKQHVFPNFPPRDEESNPNFYSGAWTPGWC